MFTAIAGVVGGLITLAIMLLKGRRVRTKEEHLVRDATKKRQDFAELVAKRDYDAAAVASRNLVDSIDLLLSKKNRPAK